jgi:hypothetical protein
MAAEVTSAGRASRSPASGTSAARSSITPGGSWERSSSVLVGMLIMALTSTPTVPDVPRVPGTMDVIVKPEN